MQCAVDGGLDDSLGIVDMRCHASAHHQNASLSHGGYHRSQGFTINQALARVRLDL